MSSAVVAQAGRTAAAPLRDKLDLVGVSLAIHARRCL